MIIECSPEAGVRLTEPSDFRNFKVVLKGTTSCDSPSMQPINLVDADNALVPIALVRTLPGCPADDAWERGYAEMVAVAREHGWIDANASAIRAHIERERQ